MNYYLILFKKLIFHDEKIMFESLKYSFEVYSITRYYFYSQCNSNFYTFYFIILIDCLDT